MQWSLNHHVRFYNNYDDHKVISWKLPRDTFHAIPQQLQTKTWRNRVTEFMSSFSSELHKTLDSDAGFTFQLEFNGIIKLLVGFTFTHSSLCLTRRDTSSFRFQLHSFREIQFPHQSHHSFQPAGSATKKERWIFVKRQSFFFSSVSMTTGLIKEV